VMTNLRRRRALHRGEELTPLLVRECPRKVAIQGDFDQELLQFNRTRRDRRCFLREESTAAIQLLFGDRRLQEWLKVGVRADECSLKREVGGRLMFRRISRWQGENLGNPIANEQAVHSLKASVCLL